MEAPYTKLTKGLATTSWPIVAIGDMYTIGIPEGQGQSGSAVITYLTYNYKVELCITVSDPRKEGSCTSQQELTFAKCAVVSTVSNIFRATKGVPREEGRVSGHHWHIRVLHLGGGQS